MQVNVGGLQGDLSSFDTDNNQEFGRDELTAMFQDFGGVGDSSLSYAEAAQLANYVLEQADSTTVDYETVMNLLDDDDDDDGVIDTGDIEEFRLEEEADENNTFTLSGENGTAFEFEFLDSYEEPLSEIIDGDGSLDADGLRTLLGGNEANYAKELAKPEVRAVLAMGLMAVGLEEAEVTFIMNELVTSPTGGEFTVNNLIEIAGEKSEDEKEDFDAEFTEHGINQ